MALEEIIDVWKEIRSGLIDEVSLIPEESLTFRATRATRSVAEIIHHIVEAQTFLVGEMCKADTNLKEALPRQLKRIKETHPVESKGAIIELLKSSMESAEATLRSFGEEALKETTERLDGKTMSKLDFMHFLIRHEMYHRGQVTVYERLMQVEPALTTKLNQFLASVQQSNS
jgi:uncharacterized damage-inducible protein DinB